VVVASLDVPWRGERGGPVTARAAGEELTLAFDHAEILGLSVKRLRGKLGYAPVGYELLPPNFTLRQLQDIHEAILGRALNKDSFRRQMLAGGQLRPTGRREAGVAYRPAELYRFVKRPTARPAY
jgi:8-oxo-dGTP diphosphatase